MKNKKVIFVARASRGIGKANYNVAVFGRVKKKLLKLKKKLRQYYSNSFSFFGDVADEKFVKNSMAKVF